MKALEKVTGGLSVVLIVLNMLGGIVAGIWLAVLGEWGAIGRGLLFGICGGFVISLAMMPGLLLAGPAVAFLNRGNRIGFYTFGLASSIYTFAVLTAWCIVILFFFAGRADSSSAIPMLLWSYGVATGPIAYLAQKDMQSGNEYAGLGAFFSQIAYVLTILALLFFDPSRLGLLVTFGAVMVVGLVCQQIVAFSESRAVDPYGRA